MILFDIFKLLFLPFVSAQNDRRTKRSRAFERLLDTQMRSQSFASVGRSFTLARVPVAYISQIYGSRILSHTIKIYSKFCESVNNGQLLSKRTDF
jgi:hypothetical protein